VAAVAVAVLAHQIGVAAVAVVLLLDGLLPQIPASLAQAAQVPLLAQLVLQVAQVVMEIY
jgi:type II secretory pathway component PulF